MKVSIADALETITIDLWGVDYDNQYVTKSTAKPCADLWAEAQAADAEGDLHTSVVKMAELLDHRLKPKDGKAQPASKVILEKWDADEVSRDHILRVINTIGGPT